MHLPTILILAFVVVLTPASSAKEISPAIAEEALLKTVVKHARDWFAKSCNSQIELNQFCLNLGFQIWDAPPRSDRKAAIDSLATLYPDKESSQDCYTFLSDVYALIDSYPWQPVSCVRTDPETGRTSANATCMISFEYAITAGKADRLNSALEHSLGKSCSNPNPKTCRFVGEDCIDSKTGKKVFSK